eukprot:TRINITY_DN2122_c0_g1_i3.p1 TRINITY_DN2122_c0_g1~~TRINITY_DN2122_c0_g1_i3.p1  ORF type:complete len:460 (-),score=46.15 TRINITY_DN2122_c0_g1_i3:256-1635(-)
MQVDKLRQYVRRFTLSEISGALGDLGTFLPLLIGLVVQTGLNLGTTLIGTGIYNIITGLQFDIPMPVQPMKTIAAVALSENGLTVTQVCLAGIMVSGIVFLLGVTKLIRVVSRIIPLSLIRGIQLGLGINLARKGFVMAVQESNGGWADPGRIVMGSLAMAFIFITTLPSSEDVTKQSSQQQTSKVIQSSSAQLSCSRKKGGFPAALIVVIFGLVYALFTQSSATSDLEVGPSKPELITPITWEDVRVAGLRAALPQLPLTLLNSVVSICKLSEDIFPEKPAGTVPVSVSVGLMNLLGGWVGVMPCCHGAGGLAAQVKFGAESGAAVVFLGLIKLALGLLFGSSLFSLFSSFPKALLGAMLLFSGIELASVAKDQKGQRNWLLLLITAVGCLAKNTAVGFLAGVVAYVLSLIVDLIMERWSKRKTLLVDDLSFSSEGQQSNKFYEQGPSCQDQNVNSQP